VSVASIIQPCSMHASYYIVVWFVRLYHIFPQYLINGTTFGKKLLNIKCVFRVSLQLWSETFPILRIIKWDIIKNVYWSLCKVPVILVLMKHDSSRQIFEKYSNIKCHENRSTGSRVVPRARSDMTDGDMCYHGGTYAASDYCGREGERAIMWRAENGIPSSVGGGGGNFPNATALLRRNLRLTWIHCSVFWHYWWMKFHSIQKRLVSVWIRDNGEVAERIRK
jgi:hypothetical protein